MKHSLLYTLFFCALCLLFAPACRQQAQLAKYKEETAALPRFRQIIQSADKAEIELVHVILDRKVTLPVPPEQLAKLKEHISRLRPVPPRHRAPEMSALAFARLHFSGSSAAGSDIAGLAPSIDILRSITSESAALAKGASCPAPLYLPDSELAAFEALPVIIQARQTIACLEREAESSLRQKTTP